MRALVAAGAVLALAAGGVLFVVSRSDDIEPPPLGVDRHGDALPAFARARLGRAPLPYASHGVAFLPSGRHVVCARFDGTWATVDLETGDYANEHRFHDPGDGAPGVGPRKRSIMDKIAGRGTTASVERLHNVALSGNGSRLAVARGANVLVFETATGEVIEERQMRGGYARNVALSPSGRWLVVLAGGGPMGGTDSVIDLSREEAERPVNLRGSIGVAISDDGRLVAGVGPSLTLLDVQLDREIVATEKQGFSRWGVAISADGTRVAYLRGKEVEVVMCDATTGEELWARSDLNTWRQAAFSPDGTLLVVRNHVLDTATGETVHTIPSGAFAFSADGTFLAVGPVAGGVHVVDTRDWSDGSTSDGWDGPPKTAVKALAFTADSTRLATLTNLGTIDVWDATDGRHLTGVATKSGGWTNAFAVSADGGRALILTLTKEGSAATLWDVESGTRIASAEGTSTGTFDVAFRGEQALLATCPDEKDLVVVSVDPGGSQELHRVAGQGGKYAWTRFSSDGEALWTRGTGGLNLVDLTSRGWMLAKGFQANHADLSPDGEHIVAFDGSGLLAGPVAGGAPTWSIDVSDPSVGSSDIPMAISPGGRYLAVTAYTTPIIELWAVGGRKRLARFDGHTRAIKDMAFSPDGKTLATASNDGTVLLWDLTPFLDAGK